MRGAIGPNVGLFKQAAKEIKAILKKEGVADMPLGLDICEPPMLFALQEEGIEVRDGQQMMLLAREHQESRRDHAAEHRLQHGRRRLSGHRRRIEARRQGKPDRGAGDQASCTKWVRIAWKRSTRYPVNAAVRIRTISRIA